MPATLRSFAWPAAAAGCLVLAATVAGLRTELASLRTEHRLAVRSQTELQAELGGVDRVVDRLIDERVEPLLADTEAEISALETSVAQRDALIARLEAAQSELLQDGLQERIEAIDAAIGARFDNVETRVDDALQGIDARRHEIEDLRAKLPQLADPDELWAEIVAPVVQINGEYSVGSAILLESQPVEGGQRTAVLTAWHVVRDVQEDSSDPVTPVPVRIFLEGAPPRDETARVVAWNVERDIALLVLETLEGVPNGARIASWERLLDVRTFDSIFAVGCPLGTEPMPTFGSIASRDHRVDGLRYWMINAPTYIGNSGGGIFDAETGELVGVFSKIYNHGNLRPTIVPHMGLVIPLDEVYLWLEEQGFAVEQGGAGTLTIAPTEGLVAVQPRPASAAPARRPGESLVR